jgi:hypothetical protein
LSEQPYDPVDYEPEHVSAIQLLERGECPEHLQKIAFEWIVTQAAGLYDQSYRTNPYDTAFAEGRRFVGNTIIKMLKIDAAKLRRVQ